VTFEIRALCTELIPAWTALFEGAGVACHCRYWHFEGTKNDWLARCAFAPETNAREQAEQVSAGAPGARGLVALREGQAVEWMKLTPRAALPKLRALPAYRAAADEGLYAVGCLLVHPAWRRRGVARALVAAIDAHVLSWGGRAVCAFPRRAAEPIHDEEAWMGPYGTFVAHGFREVAGEGPYPVLRKDLTPAPGPGAPSSGRT